MPKIEVRLMEGRIEAVLYLWKIQYSAGEIGKILHLTTSRVYSIIKTNQLSPRP